MWRILAQTSPGGGLTAPVMAWLVAAGVVTLGIGYLAATFIQGWRKGQQDRQEDRIKVLETAQAETSIWKEKSERLEGEMKDLTARFDEFKALAMREKEAADRERSDLHAEIKALRIVLSMTGTDAPQAIVVLADRNLNMIKGRIDELEARMLAAIEAHMAPPDAV